MYKFVSMAPERQRVAFPPSPFPLWNYEVAVGHKQIPIQSRLSCLPEAGAELALEWVALQLPALSFGCQRQSCLEYTETKLNLQYGKHLIVGRCVYLILNIALKYFWLFIGRHLADTAVGRNSSGCRFIRYYEFSEVDLRFFLFSSRILIVKRLRRLLIAAPDS